MHSENDADRARIEAFERASYMLDDDYTPLRRAVLSDQDRKVVFPERLWKEKRLYDLVTGCRDLVELDHPNYDLIGKWLNEALCLVDDLYKDTMLPRPAHLDNENAGDNDIPF